MPCPPPSPLFTSQLAGKTKDTNQFLSCICTFLSVCVRVISIRFLIGEREEMEEKPARSTVGKFVIEAEEAQAMAKESGVAAVRELLPLLVPAAQRLARPPISNYRVGAVGLGASGRIFLGVNLEFPGLPLHHSVHAEQFLMANANAHGEPSIRCVAVSSVPCGHCRQFLQEIRGAAEIQILVTSDEDPAFRPLASLLPHPFGPPDLLHKDAPLLLEPHDNDFGALDATGVAVGGGGLCNGIGGGGLERRLREAAEGAARSSHAPYSGCAAGFAVADGGGRVYSGSYVESAAYNPSLGPAQAAMVACLAAGGGGGGEGEGGGWGIVAAALVEKETAAVSHEGTARIFLEAVAPGAHLKVYRFRPSTAV
ncbi:unnamed protein product [Musa acuminata subsp. burmannicoides]